MPTSTPRPGLIPLDIDLPNVRIKQGPGTIVLTALARPIATSELNSNPLSHSYRCFEDLSVIKNLLV